jgi:hypothetical protein
VKFPATPTAANMDHIQKRGEKSHLFLKRKRNHAKKQINPTAPLKKEMTIGSQSLSIKISAIPPLIPQQIAARITKPAPLNFIMCLLGFLDGNEKPNVTLEGSSLHAPKSYISMKKVLR